jgi:titin
MQSLGYNLSPDTTCAFTGPGDQQNVDPMLAPLANNGGLTQTQTLMASSPAIDAGPLDCPPPALDQRGQARPKDGNGDSVARCDIGAFEADTQAGGTPAAPSNVSISNITDTSLNVNFQDNANNESGFELERGPAIAGPFALLTPIGVLPGQTTWYYTNSGLTVATQYCYRLRAKNGALYSAYSNIACGTTSGAANIPAAPSNVSLSNASDTAMNVNFLDNATNETAIEFERGTSVNGPFTLIISSGALAGTQTWYYPASGLTAGQQYCWRLRARNGSFVSPYSNTACAMTTNASLPPAVPSLLGLSNVTASSLNVNFQDNANNETGIEIERGNFTSGPFGLVVTSGVLSGTQTWYYPDSGLTSGTQYYYRLRARNGTIFSAYSQVICATAGGSGAIPAAPSNVSLSQVTSDSLHVNFQDNATNEDAIDLERGLSMGGPYVVIVSSAPLPGTATWYYPDSGLSPGAAHCYRLRARNGAGFSAYTSPVCATTLP